MNEGNFTVKAIVVALVGQLEPGGNSDWPLPLRPCLGIINDCLIRLSEYYTSSIPSSVAVTTSSS